MLKKTITYKDLDGNDVTEDFYFNISKPELAELDMVKDGFGENLLKLVAAEDGAEIMKIFKDIIGLAIGRRGENNRSFDKSSEITRQFFQSDAWSVLFMDILESEDSGASMINAMLPGDIVNAVEAKKTTDVELPEPEGSQLAYIRENRDPTPAELRVMTTEQMVEAFRVKNDRVLREASVIVPSHEDVPDTI